VFALCEFSLRDEQNYVRVWPDINVTQIFENSDPFQFYTTRQLFRKSRTVATIEGSLISESLNMLLCCTHSVAQGKSIGYLKAMVNNIVTCITFREIKVVCTFRTLGQTCYKRMKSIINRDLLLYVTIEVRLTLHMI